MGIDTDGGMIIGERGHKIEAPEGEDFADWAEDNKLERMAMYYDADTDDCYYGFTIVDVLVEDMTGEWLQYIHKLANKFEELTGVPAMLIGTQDVW